MNDEELKKENPLLYKVAREGGTETPFSGKYYNHNEVGMYSCAVCGNPLFPSTAKFHSDLPGLSGWPSFDEALPNAVEYKDDNSLGMHRTEVICAKCKSHLGHLFDDPEAKTGKHFCTNSVCLDFKKE
jgi:peptide-methionine (R)-S-oxide reductase